MTDSNFDLAIIGLGPRGHFALERFIEEVSRQDVPGAARILLFEETEQLGNGPVWDTSQSDSNWSNVNERILELPARPKIDLGDALIEGFPSYHDWSDYDPIGTPSSEPDHYPPRNLIGAYLHQRFNTLLSSLSSHGIAQLVRERVDEVAVGEPGLRVTTRSGASYSADQVLLAVGHQSTRHDTQIEGWQAEIEPLDRLRLFADPYPVEPIVNLATPEENTYIAIRGYGLATIDIVRSIAEAHGSFTRRDELSNDLMFTLTKKGSLNLIPFSLDGLPMGPKPISEELDSQFAPVKTELEELGQKLGDPELQKRASGKAFLLDALVPVIGKVFRALDHKFDGAPSDRQAFHQLITAWIDDPTQDHKCFLDTGQPPIEFLKNLVQMADGTAPISLDYCIGQVWRHCHPTIYKALSHGALKDDVLAEVIFTDEAMKRYAFGPPAEGLRQLIALHEAGVLTLDFVADPEIAVTEQGWILTSEDKHATAQFMVNAVLDAPKIADVCTPLIERLLQDGLLAPVHNDLGVATTEDGYAISMDGSILPIAVLGRLAKGTIVGVDAMLECFGDRPRSWAIRALQRLNPAQ
ncbi:FAD/NAD(P)-binding protein (plasmid) [Phaeobacter inhibens]|uniref:FAD/NAD(P)-binding protein n=1 Tax=Phaeobacter inhibens TaxID=221822 RepID=UPI0021A2F861|nr:FAD/NAD(P)-binding domain-containing protein [Phaeobacter inhibens]UWR86361.1 FAD/NAD(P)-binding protein [Phaeobacter inhibens]